MDRSKPLGIEVVTDRTVQWMPQLSEVSHALTTLLFSYKWPPPMAFGGPMRMARPRAEQIKVANVIDATVHRNGASFVVRHLLPEWILVDVRAVSTFNRQRLEEGAERRPSRLGHVDERQAIVVLRSGNGGAGKLLVSIGAVIGSTLPNGIAEQKPNDQACAEG